MVYSIDIDRNSGLKLLIKFKRWFPWHQTNCKIQFIYTHTLNCVRAKEGANFYFSRGGTERLGGRGQYLSQFNIAMFILRLGQGDSPHTEDNQSTNPSKNNAVRFQIPPSSFQTHFKMLCSSTSKPFAKTKNKGGGRKSLHKIHDGLEKLMIFHFGL